MGALRDELGRILSYQERHRRLLARLGLVVFATALIDLAASIVMYELEHGTKGTETFGLSLRNRAYWSMPRR